MILLPLIGYSQYAEYDWEDRDRWMPLKQLFAMAEIREDSRVAEIGCHEGYMTIHLADEIGSSGRVYAVDVRQDRLDSLKDHLEERELSNVKVVLGDYDDPKLPNNALDVVFIIDTYHEIKSYRAVLRHVYKSLKAGGRLLVLEKLKSWVKTGSRQEQTDAHSLGPKYVRKELLVAGFRVKSVESDLGDWEEDSNKPMWAILAVKPKPRAGR